MESSPRCATLPLPPPLPSSLPTKRLQTQMHEAPACVQHAMMTKDKKPFTYTPGGIDLSQIKSPRMARRIERNANCEGVTNTPKVSPLAQPNRTNLPSAVVSSGMPVQVFPTGPPAPPPPPPKQLNDTNKATNGTQRTEKTPIKSFEPPPIGFRPEIKIPPNPMATLKPAPKPQLKNDFWVEEYKKERSKSPLVQKDERNNGTSNELPNTQQPLTPKADHPTNNYAQTAEHRPNTPKRQWSPQRISTPVAESTSPQLQCESPSSKSNSRVDSPFSSQQPNPLLPKPLSPIKMENANTKQVETQKQPEEVLSRQQRELIHQQEVLEQIRRQQRWQQPPPQQQQNIQQQQQQQQQQYQQQQPMQQQPQNIQQFQQQQFKRPERDAQPIQNVNLGTYNVSPSHSEAFSLLTQETPQWMSKRGNVKETPEWVDRDDVSANAAKNKFVSQEERPQQNAPRERIIPIQIERTPPVSSASFDYPQAYYNNNVSNNSNYAGPVHNNPNKFVDQGYSNFAPSTADESSKFVRNSQQPSRGARAVPIQIEGQTNPFNVTVSDSVSQSPIVLQKGNHKFIIHDCPFEAELRFRKNRLSDPRTLERQTSWGNSSPNQSKSFRVLQKITDHETETANLPAELQGPQYSKPLGPADMNENQLRKLQLNENEMRRFKNNANDDRGNWAQAAPTNGSDNNVINSKPSRRFAQQHAVFQPEDQSQSTYQADPKLYSGSSIPSRSFKILQAMVTPENAAEDETSDIDSQLCRSNESNSFEYPYDLYENDNPYSNYEHTNAFDTAKKYLKIKTDENSLSSLDMPRIVVTPTPEDERLYQQSQQNDTQNLQKEIENRNTFMMLSQKLRSMAEPFDDDDLYCENNRFSRHDINMHRRLTPITECSSSSSNCNISSLETDTSDDESDLDSDDKNMESFCRTPSLKRFNSSLQVANSFSNIKTDNSSNQSDTSDEEDDTEESDSEEEQSAGKEKENVKRQCSGLLDVIVEEEEATHPKMRTRTSSFNSTSSLSDSTAKDDCSKQISKINKVESVPPKVQPVQPVTKCTKATDKPNSDSETEYEYITETEYEEETEQEEESPDEQLEDEGKKSVNIKDDAKKSVATVNQNKKECVLESETEYEYVTETEYEEETEVEEESSEEESTEEESTHEQSKDKEKKTVNIKDGEKKIVPIANQNKKECVLESETEYEYVTETEYEEETEVEEESTAEESSDEEEEEEEEENENENVKQANVQKPVNVVPKVTHHTPAPPPPPIRQLLNGTNKITNNTQRTEKATFKSFEPPPIGFRPEIKIPQNPMAKLKPVPKPQPKNEFWFEEYRKERSKTKDKENLKLTIQTEADEDPDDRDEQDDCREAESTYCNDNLNISVKIKNTEPRSNDLNGVNVYASFSKKDIYKNKDEENKCLELPVNRTDYIRNNKNSIQPSVSENDVSVSFSIPSRSSSTEHNSWHSKASSLEASSSRPSIEYEDSDSEVSVNVFLPKRAFEKDVSKPTAKPVGSIENNIRKTFTTSDAQIGPVKHNLIENAIENEKTEKMCDKTDSDEKLDEPIICVREKIAIFECPTPFKKPEKTTTTTTTTTTTNNSKPYRPIKSYLAPVAENKTVTKKSSIEESELEDDSGVTSDVSRPDTDTESECFVELRKLTRYQRAATHSRLFKLLQGENFDENEEETVVKPQRTRVPYKPKKIIHNVSITRKTNPNAVNEMESHAQRRQRLSLNFNQSSSIDNDNISTSPSSPVNENLVKELVQSILKKEGKSLQNVPASRLHAAAKRVLQEDLDSLENTCSSSSFESTPVLTPQEFKGDYSDSYSDYYDSWDTDKRETFDILPSKAFKNLREQSICGRKRQLWAARCPRVLSSKSVNRDLGQVLENREPSSPDPYIPYNLPYKSANRMSEVFKITNDE